MKTRRFIILSSIFIIPLLISSCSNNYLSSLNSVHSYPDTSTNSGTNVSVHSYPDTSTNSGTNVIDDSLRISNSEVLKHVGTTFLELAFADENNHPRVTRSMKEDVLSNLSYIGFTHYWSGLLMRHLGFDSSLNIVKFEHNILFEGQSQPFLMGCLVNISVDRTNNEIIVKVCEGEGINLCYAFIMSKLKYDFNNNVIGDCFFVTGSFGYVSETDSIDYSAFRSCTFYQLTGNTLKNGDYEDEECKEMADSLISPFVNLIPDAKLVDGNQARAYIEDYCSTGEYENSLGGRGTPASVVD